VLATEGVELVSESGVKRCHQKLVKQRVACLYEGG
jgi:hypothetical protein